MKGFLITAGIIYLVMNNTSLKVQTTNPQVNDLLKLPYYYPLKNILFKRDINSKSFVDISLSLNNNLSLLP